MKTFITIVVTFWVTGTTMGGLNGTASTTRYWDCCKPSCAWKEHVGDLNPVDSCSKDGVAIVNASVQSGCESGGSAYVCNNLQPWAVNNSFSYGFVAASFTGGVDNSQCCVCLQLTFQQVLANKTMIVQNVNTGSDLGANQFDIQIPGGGVGYFASGCSSQWNVSTTVWGEQYGGVFGDSDCDNLPTSLRAGCHWRFGWFENENNPDVIFEQVSCPKELTSLSGCSNDDFL